MTREELIERLNEVRARRAVLDTYEQATHNVLVERAELKAEQIRIEGQLALLSKQTLSVTDREAIRAAIGYVRDDDPDLARHLDRIVNGGSK